MGRGMDQILHESLGWLIFWLCLIPTAAAVSLYLVTQHGPLASHLQSYRGVVAPFFASVGIVFAVFAAFLGADIWERVQHSNHSLEMEAAAVESIVQIAGSLGPTGAPIVHNFEIYVHATLELELGKGSKARSPIADAALGEAVQAILALSSAGGTNAAAQSTMLGAYETIWQARATRRHIANTHSDPYKWMAVIFLGILTQVSLALCHIDQRKPLIAALVIFTLAFVGTMAALAIHERPLADPKIVSLDHLRHSVDVTIGS